MARSFKRALPGPSSPSKSPKFSATSEDEPRCPILDHRDQLLATIAKYDLTVVIGSPGQGKSTQLPRMLLQAGLARRGPIAVVHVSAASAAAAATWLERSLGNAVGLETRFESRGRPGRTRLRFITDGCFLREMLDDAALDRYPVVLLDDVHLLRWQTDLVLLFLRKFLERRKHQRKPMPKLILMGSLMDSSDLLTYFAMLRSRVVFLSSSNAPGHELKCKDLASEVEVGHVPTSVQTVLFLLNTHRQGDILCFLASHYEVMNACFLARALLPEALAEASLRPLVMSLYEGMPEKELQRVVAAAPEGHRKVIFSDSLAESSMRIHGVTIVVDSGYCLKKFSTEFYSIPGRCSQEVCSAHAWYRRERARAVGRGELYRLYSYIEPSASAVIFVEPELERFSVAPAVLFGLKLRCDVDCSSFASIKTLPREQMETALFELTLLGAITEKDGQRKLTGIGELMVRLPLEIPLARALLASAELGCSAELLTISAMLNSGPIFHDFGRSVERFKKAQRRFATKLGDPVSLLLIYRAYRSAAARGDKHFCRRRCLNVSSLRRALLFRRRLRLLCLRLGLPVRSCGDDLQRVNSALTAGYLVGVVRHMDDVSNGKICHRYLSAWHTIQHLSGDSALYAASAPQVLIQLERENRWGWEISKACPVDTALVRRICPKLWRKMVAPSHANESDGLNF